MVLRLGFGRHTLQCHEASLLFLSSGSRLAVCTCWLGGKSHDDSRHAAGGELCCGVPVWRLVPTYCMQLCALHVQGSGQFLLSVQVGLGLHALCSRSLVQAYVGHSLWALAATPPRHFVATSPCLGLHRGIRYAIEMTVAGISARIVAPTDLVRTSQSE